MYEPHSGNGTAVDSARATFFDRAGGVSFDSAFVMRDVAHTWQRAPAPESSLIP